MPTPLHTIGERSINGLRLIRRVEMYQWQEIKRTSTSGSGADETKVHVDTYHNTKVWSEVYHNSELFRVGSHHRPKMKRLMKSFIPCIDDINECCDDNNRINPLQLIPHSLLVRKLPMLPMYHLDHIN